MSCADKISFRALIFHRKDCEGVCEDLVTGGVTASYYHADMEPAARLRSHKQWSEGRVQVIVATVAFGMGEWLVFFCFLLEKGFTP